MDGQQNFWECLQKRYEEKNRELLKREAELRYRLEALNPIIGDGCRAPSESRTPCPGNCKIQPTVPQQVPDLLSNPPKGDSQNTDTTPPVFVPQQTKQSQFKSCSCPPPQEKVGFFKCMLSMLPSLRNKNAPSPTPPSKTVLVQKNNNQESVTNERLGKEQTRSKMDENKKNKDDLTVYKNENCMCSPCPIESAPSPKKDESFCSYSICSNISDFNNTNKIQNVTEQESVCICNICDDSNNVNNTPQNTYKKAHDICTCSVCSKISGNKDGLCCCNIDLLSDELLSQSAPVQQREKNGSGTSNKMSLKSLDLYYMKNIHDLATRQKTLLNNVNDLERKAQIYENVFKEHKDADFAPKDQKISNLNAEVIGDPDQKTNAELKLENFLLKSELKDMRLEVRQYLERMEGPMQFKIESERYKNKQLEQQLDEAAKELADTQELYQKELNVLKMQLCTANTNVYNLTTANQQLNEDVETYKTKCTQLEEDLIRQKISEAESLKAMQAALKEQQTTKLAPSTNECNLHQIARELSSILKECEPCGQCIYLPDDLTAAAKLLKSLTDMIDQKLPKDEGKEKGEKNIDTLFSDVVKDRYSRKDAEVVKDIDTTKVSVGLKEESLAAKHSEAGKSILDPQCQCVQCPGLEVTQDENKPSNVQLKETEVVVEPLNTKQSSSKTLDLQCQCKECPGLAIEKSERSIKESLDVKQSEAGKSDKSHKGSLNVEQKTSIPQSVSKTLDTQCQCIKCSKLETGNKPSDVQPTEIQKSKLKEEKSEKDVADEAINLSKKTCKCAEVRKLVTEKESKFSSASRKKTCKCKRKSGEIKEFVPAAYIAPIAAPENALDFKKSCKCDKKLTDIKSPMTDIVAKSRAPDGVDQIWPKEGEKIMVSHQVTASRSKELIKSQTAMQHVNIKENFPFKVDTHVDVLDKRPDGVHVTTTITNSGVLEVVTEGPEGFIETTLIYTSSGNVEVATEILEYNTKGKTCNRGTIKAMSPDIKAIEGPRSGSAIPEKCLKSLPDARMDIPQIGYPQNDVGQNDLPLLQPNCHCKVCPALGEEIETHSPVSGPQVSVLKDCVCTACPSQTQATLAQKDSHASGPQVNVPKDCVCVTCPSQAQTVTIAGIQNGENPEKDTTESSAVKLPDDCKCISCPQTDPIKNNDQMLKEDSVENVSTMKLPNACKCQSCVHS